MRPLFGFLLAGALILLVHGTAYAQTKQTYTGDLVVLAYAVNPDKTGDYDQVVAKVKDALMKSEKPEAKQQLVGWRVMRAAKPQPDGSILYVHVINPVPDADYSLTNIVYDVVKDPAEQKAFFELYRGALKAALFGIEGSVTADLSK